MTKREKWLAQMLKIADPVIRNLAQEELREQIPQEFHADRNSFILLEAFARTVNGLAPWLELEGLSGKERELQEEYRRLIRAGIDRATDPVSKDYMDFGQEWGQPLVDAGFLAHAIVRAPQQMFYVLEDSVKRNLISALKKSRKINPCPTNWLFFSVMVEAALEHLLPTDLKPAQVRCALTAVLDKMTEAETLFDVGGWLCPGIYGYQPELAEFYISTGSLYLCMAFFLPLGLPAEDAFWSEPSCAWTAKKIWQYDSSANLTGKES